MYLSRLTKVAMITLTLFVATIPIASTAGAMTQTPEQSQEQTTPTIGDEPPINLKDVNLIGSCDRLGGVGILYIRLECGNVQKSECNNRIGPANSAATVESREEVRLNVQVEALPYALTSDSLNSATFQTCDTNAPVKLARIELWNNFIVDGVKFQSCTVTGGVQGQNPIGTVACTIQAAENSLIDEFPATCTDCSELNADVYHYYARLAPIGAVTRYHHEVQGRFTGKGGSTLRVSTVADVGI